MKEMTMVTGAGIIELLLWMVVGERTYFVSTKDGNNHNNALDLERNECTIRTIAVASLERQPTPCLVAALVLVAEMVGVVDDLGGASSLSCVVEVSFVVLFRVFS
jgi:hypothetical protein